MIDGQRIDFLMARADSGFGDFLSNTQWPQQTGAACFPDSLIVYKMTG